MKTERLSEPEGSNSEISLIDLPESTPDSAPINEIIREPEPTPESLKKYDDGIYGARPVVSPESENETPSLKVARERRERKYAEAFKKYADADEKSESDIKEKLFKEGTELYDTADEEYALATNKTLEESRKREIREKLSRINADRNNIDTNSSSLNFPPSYADIPRTHKTTTSKRLLVDETDAKSKIDWSQPFVKSPEEKSSDLLRLHSQKNGNGLKSLITGVTNKFSSWFKRN